MKTMLILLFFSTPVFAGLGDCTPERVAWLDSAQARADLVDKVGYDSASYLNHVEWVKHEGELISLIPESLIVTTDSITSVVKGGYITWYGRWQVVETGEIIYLYIYRPLRRVFAVCWNNTRQERTWWIAR